jgi:hypothetical protein
MSGCADPDWTLSVEGTRRMCAAIVEQAVVDYRLLVAEGFILPGGVVPRTNRRLKWAGSLTGSWEAQELVRFFKEGGECEKILRLARLEVSADRIREKLMFTGDQEGVRHTKRTVN